MGFSMLLATKYFQIFAGPGNEHVKLLAETAKIYILGAITVAVIFFMAHAKLRIRWLQLVILCSMLINGSGYIFWRAIYS